MAIEILSLLFRFLSSMLVSWFVSSLVAFHFLKKASILPEGTTLKEFLSQPYFFFKRKIFEKRNQRLISLMANFGYLTSWSNEMKGFKSTGENGESLLSRSFFSFKAENDKESFNEFLNSFLSYCFPTSKEKKKILERITKEKVLEFNRLEIKLFEPKILIEKSSTKEFRHLKQINQLAKKELKKEELRNLFKNEKGN